MASVRDDHGVSEDDSVAALRKKRDMLKLYYGSEADSAAGTLQDEGPADPYNINGPHFQAESYLGRLLRERSLAELMDKETEMVRHIKSLDSDMQTLVYENYNKFISATDTIRKMKNDFRKMEDEMDHLATNMAAITEFSASISSTLQDRRQQITKLSGVHTLLKKLQFLFELPTRLQKCIDMEAYSQAVRYYVKSRRVLHQYQHVASFQGIQQDCQRIVDDLSSKLRDKFRDKDSSAKQLAECVDLLLQLNEPAEQLCDEFLSHARQKIDEDLGVLERQLKLQAGEDVPPEESDSIRPAQAFLNAPMDVLEFVDCGCNGFLSNMCLVIASYNDMFLNRQQDDEQLDAIAMKKLVQFVNSLMETYFQYVQRRVHLEKATGDNTLLVRALDRFHRRLQAMNKLLSDTDFSRAGTEIVSRAARDRVAHYLDTLKQHFADCLTDTRQQLAAPRLVGKTEGGGANGLSELLTTLNSSLTDQIKSVLTNLQAFIATDITFAMKAYFRGPFCRQDVREGLVVAALQNIMAVCRGFCEGLGDKGAPPPALLLILSRLCLDFEQATITYLLTLTDEQFLIDEAGGAITPVSVITTEARDTAQTLLNHYVRVQGLTISQMLRKSVEARDWLNTIEPRNVRAVMKRVVEDLTSMDLQVGQLYEEGVRKERSSDSTKRSITYSMSRPTNRTNWSFTPSTMDNSLMSNIQKLFSERIEIFSTVEFSKVSVLTGIIKISLKTFLECVRLKTFGRYGLQQVQVDTHYLQLYLWRFVSDENLVHFLLDEIVGSTLHRCLDPVTMESSVSAHRFDLVISKIEQEADQDRRSIDPGTQTPCPKLTVPRGIGRSDVPRRDVMSDLDERVYWKVMRWSSDPSEHPEQLSDDHGDSTNQLSDNQVNIKLPDVPFDEVSLDSFNPFANRFSYPDKQHQDSVLMKGRVIGGGRGARNHLKEEQFRTGCDEGRRHRGGVGGSEMTSDEYDYHFTPFYTQTPTGNPLDEDFDSQNPFYTRETSRNPFDESHEGDKLLNVDDSAAGSTQADSIDLMVHPHNMIISTLLGYSNQMETPPSIQDQVQPASSYSELGDTNKSVDCIQISNQRPSTLKLPFKLPWQPQPIAPVDYVILSTDFSLEKSDDDIMGQRPYECKETCSNSTLVSPENSYDFLDDLEADGIDVMFVTNPKFSFGTDDPCSII